MSFLLDLGYGYLEAAGKLLLHPFFYLGILLILITYRRQIQLERKLFSTRLHYMWREAWRLLLAGVGVGVAVSVVMAFVGSALSLEAVLLLWSVTLMLMLFRIRFLCMVYSSGVLAAVAWCFKLWPSLGDLSYMIWLADLLAETNAAALLALAAVLHLAEALLIRLQGARTASPLFLESKRGKLVGGFHMYGFWPLPLLLLVPAGGGTGLGLELPWIPFFGEGASGWTVLAVPMVLGFTERTLSRLPAAKAKRSSGMLTLYSLVILGCAALSHLWEVLLLPAAVLAIGLHELLIWYSAWEESKRTPFFVHDEQGLRVLSVLPGSPAEELGIHTGEIIHKVHGIRVRTREELHEALRSNSAFCKMEILNLEGQSKFVSRAMYAGEHHQLGILLCPDEQALYYVEEKQRASLISVLFRAWGGLSASNNKKELGG